MKAITTLAVVLLVAASLGGCVVAPAYPDAYYGGATYYPAPVYAGPPVVFYGSYGRGWGYGHHHHWR